MWTVLCLVIYTNVHSSFLMVISYFLITDVEQRGHPALLYLLIRTVHLWHASWLEVQLSQVTVIKFSTIKVFYCGWNLRATGCYLNSRGMALRRPAAHVRRAPGWRRSGDESCWESLILEDVLTPVARFPRAPRPQSAIEGGQLDDWLEHMHRMQSNLLTTTVHGQGPVFNNRNTSMPAFDKEATEHAWRQLGIPSFSRGSSSSCGSSSQCGSSLSSQESLQTGPFHPPECRGSSERAHIVQAARKEQPKVSSLAQVKIGWLPIQRRVMMVADACKQNQGLDQSAGQVKYITKHNNIKQIIYSFSDHIFEQSFTWYYKGLRNYLIYI